MARKKRPEEVSIIETPKNSDTVIDLEVKIKDKVIGKIHQGEEDRQLQITYMDDRKGAAISVEDAVQAIIADYNLHR